MPTFFVHGKLKWLVIILWLLVIGALSPFAARLESVQKNDQSAYLPPNAESTRVLELSRRFPGGDALPAVVAYRRAAGLTKEDLRQVAAERRAVAQLEDSSIGAPGRPLPSRDRKAVLFVVPIADVGDSTALTDSVAALREEIGGRRGLAAKVTGPAGFSADAVEVFGSLDTTLLLATAATVAVLLLLTYRSPWLWLVPLVVVGMTDQAVRAAAYLLAEAGFTISGQVAGILTVLVFGAGTDYALLTVARYREELRRHEDRAEAMALALRRAGPAIVASGGTVIVSLAMFAFAELASNQGLAPVGVIGIALTLLAMTTLLPAVLVALPRGVFWPFVPHFGSEARDETGPWAAVGRRLDRRPRLVWMATSTALVAVAVSGLVRLDLQTSQLNDYRGSVESVEGQKLLAASFPQGLSAPAQVIAPAPKARPAAEAARATAGIAAVGRLQRVDDLVELDAVLTGDPYGPGSFATIDRLRRNVKEAAGPGALVGGNPAINLDVTRSAERDTRIIVPLVLAVVLVILALLLRSLVAPLFLVATVILSFAAALGVSVLVFELLFDFEGINPSLPLPAFVFLVALGVDYNIFLMARVREETAALGTRRAMLKGLAVTGGVITSAGLVLAGTFSVLGVLPLVALTQIGFIVAFGVLLDTIVVRSILVPAITLDLGPRTWWPGRLDRGDGTSSPTR
jgi:putative drug exporter of the RND superfamily